jgi:hypothetical protein
LSQELLITITAKDGASSTFKSVGSSATQMTSALKSAATGAGGSLKQVGAAAKEAGSAIDAAGDKAAQAATDFDKLEDRATKVGAALGTAVAALSKLGASAENQRRQVSGIEKAYGDAADQILDFTDAIQSSTKFSNEDAREAAQIAATLAQNYGFTAEEIEQLITVSADLATIHGTTLADATQRTAAAMRGEAESAEALGLTLNQAAIDREGLTLSMSNEEAAHYRLNALMEQSAFATGAAGEAAATTAGQAQQAANALQDIGTAIGASLGPVAAAAAGLNDYALLLPVVAAGAGKMLASLKNASSGMSSFGASAASLVGMINPIGLAIAGVVAAGALVVGAWAVNESANAALAASYDELNAAIEATTTAQQAMVAKPIRFDTSQEEQLSTLAEKYGITENAAQDFFNFLGGVHSDFDAMTMSAVDQAKANDLLADSYLKVADGGMNALISAFGRLEADGESFYNSGDETISMLEDLNHALSYTGDGADIIQTAIQNLNAAYAEGRITTAQYAEGLDYIANNSTQYVASRLRN